MTEIIACDKLRLLFVSHQQTQGIITLTKKPRVHFLMFNASFLVENRKIVHNFIEKSCKNTHLIPAFTELESFSPQEP